MIASTQRQALVDAGLWTLGVADEYGGGGAPLDLRLTALCAIGQLWAATAWASAQAHAAAEILGAAGVGNLLEGIHSARAAVVVDGSGPAVRLEATGGRLKGNLCRIDPGGADPHVLIAMDDHTVWCLEPGMLTSVRPLPRTGMAGALSVSAEVDVALDDTVVLTGVPVAANLAMLRLAGAAIAAGIALESAERSRAYARARVQFGGPLTQLPTVRSSLFRQAQSASDALTIALNTPPTGIGAASALAGNCERAIDAAAGAVQSHGGYGYLVEYTVERLLRDAVSLRAATGAGHGVAWAAAGLALAPALIGTE